MRSPRTSRQSAFLIAAFDEDALHFGIDGGGADQADGFAGEGARIDVGAVGAHHHRRVGELALLLRHAVVGHRPEPDVGVDARLVRGVATEHGAAARLCHVADEDAGIARGLPHARGEPLYEGDELRVAVEAVCARAA